MPDIPTQLLTEAKVAISKLSPKQITELRKRHFPAQEDEDLANGGLLYEDYAYVLPMVAELVGGTDKVTEQVKQIRAAENNKYEREALDDLLDYISRGGCDL